MKFQIKKWGIEIVEELINKTKGRIQKDLNEYLKGNKFQFNYSIDLSIFTHFQRAVLGKIRKIPYGKTLSYSKLARRIGKPHAQRAVGNTCNINPLPIIIPCHRVVGKNGIGGYGNGVELKKYLLKLEDIK
ncbi:MAG: methylated-DNA--[protein]-cysteine S-methyltransferase [Candidatus Aenigmatarchaeota archaeon]